MRFIVALILLISISSAQTLTVAVASSLRPPVVKIVKLFENKKGIKVRLSFGSSGSLYRQILGGAPYDVFLSANRMYPEELVKRNKALKDTFTVFAIGRLALFSPDREVNGLGSLLSARRIAIANPRYAPYGVAAVEVLNNSGLYDELKSRLVYGSNVSQAFQFAISGGAECAIVSLSLVKSYGKGNYWIVPKELHSNIEHAGVVTKQVSRKGLALEFISFLRSEEVKDILIGFGFEAP